MEMTIRISRKRLNTYLKYEIITLFLIFVIFQMTFPALAENSDTNYIESRLKSEFNNWEDEKYDDWVCNKMAPACKEFFEIQLGYEASLIYRHRTNSDRDVVGHVWVEVTMNGELKEFESTTLQFKSISSIYVIDFIQD